MIDDRAGDILCFHRIGSGGRTLDDEEMTTAGVEVSVRFIGGPLDGTTGTASPDSDIIMIERDNRSHFYLEDEPGVFRHRHSDYTPRAEIGDPR